MFIPGAKVPYTDHVSWDRQRGRWQYVREFPAVLQAQMGIAFKRSFPKGESYPTEEMIHEADRAYTDRLYQRTPNQQRPVLDKAMLANRIELIAEIGATQAQLEEAQAALARQEELNRLREQVARLGGTVNLPDETEHVGFDQALKDLKSHDRHRQGWRDARAEKKFDASKIRAWESLSAFANDAGITDYTNMAAIPRKTIQLWSDSLDETTSVPHDYTADVIALYAALKRKNRITKDGEPYSPAGTVPVPFRPPHSPRRPFPPADAKRILEDARLREPIIEWGHWLGADAGMIESEIVQLRAADIKQVNGIWVIDMEGRLLKTPYRQRVTPIHSAFRERFLVFVGSRKGLLFDETAEQAEHKLSKHIRGLGIKGRDQVFYSWRHDVLRQLERICGKGTSRCDYLSGHAQQTIRGKHYTTRRLDDPDFVENELPELAKVIEGLRDPTR